MITKEQIERIGASQDGGSDVLHSGIQALRTSYDTFAEKLTGLLATAIKNNSDLSGTKRDISYARSQLKLADLAIEQILYAESKR